MSHRNRHKQQSFSGFDVQPTSFGAVSTQQLPGGFSFKQSPFGSGEQGNHTLVLPQVQKELSRLSGEQVVMDKSVADVIIKEDNSTTFSQMFVSGLLEGLQNEKETFELSDVQIVIGDFEFKCHRVILAACSGFFKAAFTSGMKEDLERKVTLNGISREIFADILDCMYTGKNIITESNVYELWHAASLLQVLYLLQACETFLKQNIKTENCITIYQHSKLLCSKELIPLSWSHIVQHFKFVRKFEEILMFTEEEMEKLIASPDLMTDSEDEVLEMVLSWVAYKPTGINIGDCLNEISKLVECKHDTQASSQNEDKLASDGSKVNEDPDVVTEQRNNNMKYTNTLSRVGQLSNLLNLTKVCRLSGKCLMETMNLDIVRADTRAQEILQEGLEYMLRTDRRHDLCPTSAIHRTNSKLENVVIAVPASRNSAIAVKASTNSGFGVAPSTNAVSTNDVLVCRRQSGQWCGLGKPAVNTCCPTSVMCFNSNVYLATDNLLYAYTTYMNQWREISEFTTDGQVRYFLPIGDFLYAIFQEEGCYFIDKMNATEASESDFGSEWVNIYSLPSDLTCIKCSTVVGDKIILFGTITERVKIQIAVFDTATLHYFLLNDIPPLSSADVCFRKGEESFMLSKDGTLYRLRSCSEAPFIEIKYETRLWDFDRNVKGAVLFNNELLLFGPSFSESASDKQWELSLLGVFERVKNITCNDRFSCFMHAVVPKVYLTRAVSVE